MIAHQLAVRLPQTIALAPQLANSHDQARVKIICIMHINADDATRTDAAFFIALNMRLSSTVLTAQNSQTIATGSNILDMTCNGT